MKAFLLMMVYSSNPIDALSLVDYKLTKMVNSNP